MRRIKETGPKGVARPFEPTIDFQGSLSDESRQTEALEHIAVSLSAIDHNLEVLTNKISALLNVLAAKG